MPEFRMPSLGADMDSGKLLEWLVAPGDEVHRGQVIAVVDTDKAAIEVECFDDGRIEELIVSPGQKVPVGTVLATIGTGDGTTSAAPPAPREAAPPVAVPVTAVPAAAVRSPVHAGSGAGHVTSPLVRHLAEVRGVDLAALTGTGPGGVVHRVDVEHAAAQPASVGGRRGVRASPYARRLAATAGVDLASVVGSRLDGAIAADDVRHALATQPVTVLTAPAAARAPVAPGPAAERLPSPEPSPASDEGLTKAETMRRAISALMTRSNREIPHYYLTTRIDMSVALEWMRARNRELPVEQRLVPAALLLAATARAAQAVAQLNGTWVDDAFHPADTVDLGLVISLRRGGIMVPVITDAAARSVEDIMATMRDLVERTRTGRLRGSELRPPSITVSNLGDQGVESVLGVIYPPQVALVGLGAVLERPWAVGGMLGVHPVVIASLAADHRASDGAVGARFLNRMDKLLQKPEEL